MGHGKGLQGDGKNRREEKNAIEKIAGYAGGERAGVSFC
jgi:hypothetical protein